MALFKSLLVPIDGSPFSNAAVTLAIRFAADQAASITFVNVVETDKIIAAVVPGGYADPTVAIDALRQSGIALLKECEAKAKASNVRVAIELLEGDCVAAILDATKSHGVDLIVIGSHGRGGVTRLLMGSVAEGVLRGTHLPVLVSRATEET